MKHARIRAAGLLAQHSYSNRFIIHCCRWLHHQGACQHTIWLVWIEVEWFGGSRWDTLLDLHIFSFASTRVLGTTLDFPSSTTWYVILSRAIRPTYASRKYILLIAFISVGQTNQQGFGAPKFRHFNGIRRHSEYHTDGAEDYGSWARGGLM